MAVGLKFTNSVATGPSNPTGDPNARTFFAGVTERGPLTAVVLTNLAGYVNTFGVRTSYSGVMYDAAQCYFAEGGSELAVARVVGTGASVGTHTFVDRAASALPTIRIDADNPGPYSVELSVGIVAGAVQGVTVQVFSNGSLVNTYANYVDVPSLVAAMQSDIYVNTTNLASASVAPANLPALTAPVNLSAGSNDIGTVTAPMVTAAFALFGSDMGPGAVGTPGYTEDLVDTALIAHCVANNRIALFSAPLGASLAAMKALITNTQATNPKYGDYAGLFGPWVLIPDGSNIRAIDPIGFVAGVRARAINQFGFQKAPAGTVSNARFVLGLATPLDGNTNNTWNDAGINGITVYRGNTRLYGWRSLSLDTVNFSDLTGRTIGNAVQDLTRQAVDPFAFDTIDATQVLAGQVLSAITGFMNEAALNYAFYPLLDQNGIQVDPGYSISVNYLPATTSQYGANTLQVTVGFRPSPTADLILVNIVLAGIGVTF